MEDLKGFSTHRPLDELTRELAAEASIKRAMDNYAHGIDDRDMDRWLSAFHEDAIFDVQLPAEICHGHADLTKWVQGVWETFTFTNHFTTNHTITRFVDDRHAEGIGKAIALFLLADGKYLTGGGRYADTYDERDGIWRISSRKVRINHMGDLTAGATLQMSFSEEPEKVASP